MKIIKLGSLNISEDKIVVADPSYDYGDCGTVLLKKVLSGKYFANVTTADNLITSLKICHSDYKNCDLNFERYGFIAVDSGQAGFFDKNYFVKNQGGEFGDLNSLYGLACSITMSPKQAGIIHKKAWSRQVGLATVLIFFSLQKIRRTKLFPLTLNLSHKLNWRNWNEKFGEENGCRYAGMQSRC